MKLWQLTDDEVARLKARLDECDRLLHCRLEELMPELHRTSLPAMEEALRLHQKLRELRETRTKLDCDRWRAEMRRQSGELPPFARWLRRLVWEE